MKNLFFWARASHKLENKWVYLLFFIFIMSPILFTKAQNSGTYIKRDSNMPRNNITIDAGGLIDSLELVGVGVSIESWRNHPDYPKLNIWDEMRKNPEQYVISQDVEQYPRNFPEWQMKSAKRIQDAIEAAMQEFMDQFPLPIAVVGPAWNGPENPLHTDALRRSNARDFVITKSSDPYTAKGEFSGLLTQSGRVMSSELNDNPDLLWKRLFNTFDEHIDLPAAGLACVDNVIQNATGIYFSDRPGFDRLAEQAYRPKQPRVRSDNWTFLAMIRRGRIDWLRPYAPFIKDNMTVKNRDGDPSRNRSRFDGWIKAPATPFVPTPYIEVPWTSFQIDQYDHLENLGTLYRPQVVSYLDADGKPVSAAERVVRMETALRTALAPLNGKTPARIFYDYGSVWDDRASATRFLPLVQSLHSLDAQFDLLDPKRGYDLARILGDTGAGSPFVAVALASMAGRQSGGPTLVANLRRNDGATLLLVTPPSAEQMKKDAAIKRPFWPRNYK